MGSMPGHRADCRAGDIGGGQRFRFHPVDGRLVSRYGCRRNLVRHRWRLGHFVEADPRAAEAVRVLGSHHIPCSYLTNTTTRTRQQIAAALCQAGITVRPDEVITAALLTADYVRANCPDARCFLVNNGPIQEDMPGIDIVDSLR